MAAKISLKTTVAGISIASEVNRTEEVETSFSATPDAGKAGTLTTRTDDDTGVVTIASGHGITTSDTVAIFWPGGSRHGMAVSASAATTITIDSGAGTVLPVATTAVVIAKESTHDLAIVGDDIVVLAIGSAKRASVNFLDGTDASLLRYDMTAKEGRLWFTDHGVTNPLAGDTVASVVLACGETTASEIRIGVLIDSNG
jgi:hypothetical protein